MLPGACWGWGTLTELLPMEPAEEQQLRNMLNHFGVRKEQSLAEILPRQGPHPTHQFIVRQAYMLLEQDPAYEGSPWKLPSLNSVLAWDGIGRRTTSTAPIDGMWERDGPGVGLAAIYAPAKDKIGGPSADAEITRGGKWNPDYVAAYHYWNPWLECGEAPKATGQCYISLIKAMALAGDENAKAKAVSHLGHYLTDVICPKHADMIALDRTALERLTQLANEWFAEHEATPTMNLETWLGSERVTRARDIVVRASGVPLTHPYWRRVNAQIGQRALLKPNKAWIDASVDISQPSLRGSVAGMLGALRHRPDDKDLARFYGFFDPFYYNGQIVMTWSAVDGESRSRPILALTTPGGEHLMWESNPDMFGFIGDNANKMIRSPKLEDSYVPLPEDPGLWSTDTKVRGIAYKKAIAEFTKNASLEQHGTNPLSEHDFDHGAFRDSLSLSVKYMFSALRACTTAIRCDASYAYFPEEEKFRVYCDVSNVAEEAVQIKALRVWILSDGKIRGPREWVKTISCTVAKGTPRRLTIELPRGKVAETAPELYVDVFGRYSKTPDLGWWHGEVSQRPPRIMHGMSLPAFDRVKGALDLAIVFDVTGSMGSSINSVRDDATTVLTKLKARLGDVRVALVSFRDVKADKDEAFSVTPFSSNIKKAISTMKGWTAKGGGDTPEDQLQAIRLALDMWARTKNDPRKPTKIVVVITDAPPHDPDFKGNTQASIAAYAERVDPAHIYPIVVGTNSQAHAKAAELARLTGGEVLTAKTGDEVASALAEAVEKAVATHGTGGGAAGIPPWAQFYGGLTVAAVAGTWVWRDRRRRARM